MRKCSHIGTQVLSDDADLLIVLNLRLLSSRITCHFSLRTET
jgi:hypothetical protein